MPQITITNRNDRTEITLKGLSQFEVQFLADLVTPVNADWAYESDTASPRANKAAPDRKHASYCSHPEHTGPGACSR